MVKILQDEPGFANDVYIHASPNVQEIEGVSYSGPDDYTLCGAQRALWFLEQFQLGYVISPPQNCIQMLHDREVFGRVENLLISGLQEDSSTYLVTDSNQPGGGSNLYFAIQILHRLPTTYRICQRTRHPTSGLSTVLWSGFS